jgi:transcriptional regulator with XRE-family HTH domain
MTEEGIRIGARLRAAREEAGLSQGQAAKLLGTHRPTISEIEAGRRRVQADELSQFAKMYHVSVSWLLGEEGGVDPHEEKARVAARELMKLKAEDLDRVMNLVKSFRRDATALKGGKRR